MNLKLKVVKFRKSFDWIEEKWTSVKDKGIEVIDFFTEAYEKIGGFFRDRDKISGGWNSTKSFFGFGTPNNEIPGYATSGGIVTAPTLAMIGEGGVQKQ